MVPVGLEAGGIDIHQLVVPRQPGTSAGERATTSTTTASSAAAAATITAAIRW
jgi:hypothetical protein